MCFRWCCPERYERVDGGRERRQRRARNFEDEESQRGDADLLRKRALTSSELEILDRISTNLESEPKDWSKMTTDEASAFVATSLSPLTMEPLRYDAICSLLITECKRQRRKGRKEIHEFIRHSAALLSEDQQVEMMDILMGLPPAVLGDVQDREFTRVLLDLTSDIRSALTDVRHYHHETDKVKSVIDALEPLVKVESLHAETVVALMQQLSPHSRFQTVMNQLLLAHLVSPDKGERRTLFAYLFRRLPPEELVSSNS